jgi:capsular polysaccharide biosynthesis protein
MKFFTNYQVSRNVIRHFSQGINLSPPPTFKSNFPIRLIGNHLGNFAHTIIDHLPNLIWLNQFCENHYIFLHDVTHKRRNPYDTVKYLLSLLNIELQNIHFIKDSVDLPKHYVDFHLSHHRFAFQYSLLKNYIDKLDIIETNPNLMIYCTRNSGGRAGHKRQMDDKNELEIILASVAFCQKHNLEFYCFDGTHEGQPMSIESQFKLFRRAKIVAGPHGGAFANVIAIPQTNDCHVCEFSEDRVIVHQRGLFRKNYSSILRFFPEHYLDYSLIPFEEGSTTEVTQISINNYKNWLDQIHF